MSAVESSGSDEPGGELVYANKASPTEDGQRVMSEKVASLASNIYQEFERMMKKYDEEVVKDLMPLVVVVLESLDAGFSEKHEQDVEMELLREDNEQLLNQFEREKQLRKVAEERLLELEDRYEEFNKELQEKQEALESASRMLELKARNATEHSNRLEEKENEHKAEYTKLKERYNELLRTHMEHMERTKIMMGGEATKGDAGASQPPRQKGTFQLPPLRHVNRENSDEPVATVHIPASTPASEQPPVHPVDTASPNESDLRKELTDLQREEERRAAAVDDIVESTPELDDIDEPPQMDEGGLQVNIAGASDAIYASESLFDEVNFENPDALGDMDDGADMIAERKALEEHFAEYDEEHEYYERDSDYAQEESGFFGMHKEIENLIKENYELIETKNALNIVKDDLIAKVDEFTGENEMLRGELESAANSKLRLKNRLSELEEEVKSLKEELEKLKKNKSADAEEDDSVPMAQRKRFTRVEMARVLMERNQYKERLMELQEAVRWTEMVRASKAHPEFTAKDKKRSSLWNLFSDLFSSGSRPSRSAAAPTTAVRYESTRGGAGGSPIRPIGDPNRREREALGMSSEQQRAFDFMREDSVSSGSLSEKTRRERREQYRAVKAHVKKESGRIQAYGWSLPSKMPSASRGGVPVPVPIYCRPLLEKQPGMKVWCAAGVNVSGGRTRDGGSLVGTGSVFYTGEPEPPSPGVGAGGDMVEQLSAEVQRAAANLAAVGDSTAMLQNGDTSLVWICTTAHAHSQICVIDANHPADLLDAFVVTQAHILCVASVPGATQHDYPPVGAELLVPDQPPSSASLAEAERPTEQSTAMGSVQFVQCAVAGRDAEEEEAQEVTEEETPAGVTPGVAVDPLGAAADVIKTTVIVASGSPASETGSPVPGGSGPSSLRSSPAPPGAGASPGAAGAAGAPQGMAELIRDGLSRDIDRVTSVQATMWIGCQTGSLYVHSAVANWRKCLHSVKLKDSVLSIVHVRGRVLVGLADGTVAVFHRGGDGQWDLSAYHLMDLGRPAHSVRCLSAVHATSSSTVWAGYQNRIMVLDPRNLKLETVFDAHPRKESQVRQLAAAGDGVWVSIRLESTLRLYHATSYQHLQDVDIEPYVSKMLGTSKLGPGFSFVRITCLQVAARRLWVGTGNGVVISIPLADSDGRTETAAAATTTTTAAAVEAAPNTNGGVPGLTPFVNLNQAQLSFHGHRDAVKFFVAVPGQASKAGSAAASLGTVAVSPRQSPSHQQRSGSPARTASAAAATSMATRKNTLVMSGGEGYIDFRVGDAEDEDSSGSAAEGDAQVRRPAGIRSERSHLIVWQVSDPT